MKTLLAVLFALFLQTPKANLEGVVTRPDGKQPVVGARLTLRLVGARTASPATAVTNAQGQFTFTNLDEGSYNIQAEADGHVPQPSPAQAKLTAGQTTRNVEIRLTPVATISGRIRDPQGRPVVDVPVTLLQSGYNSEGRRIFRSAGTVRTNDLGEYRIYWVTPGRYYMLAGTFSSGVDQVMNTMQNLMGGASASGTRLRPAVVSAFYPGVGEMAMARPLDLQPGTDLQGMDFSLTPNPPTFRVTGRVIDSRTGQAPLSVSVALTRIPSLDQNLNAVMAGDFPNRNYNPATGTFELRDVLPGTYLVNAVVSSPTGQNQAGGSAAVTVSDKDVGGLAVSISPGLTIQGRVRVEGTLPFQMPINCLKISLVPLAGNPPLMNLNGECKQVAADGTFSVSNIHPGNYGVAVSASGLPPGASFPILLTTIFGGYVKEALFQGSDVFNSPLRVASDQAGGSLDVVIAIGGGGKIDGTVTDATLKPLPGKRVVLVPERARFQWQLYKTATTNANGQFSFSTLGPGAYRLFAWEVMEENAWFDPEVMARYEPMGSAVRVTETSSETVVLRIIPAEGGR